DSMPPAHFKETMNTILTWMQQSETKLSVPQVAVAEYEIMEQRLRELKVSNQAVGMTTVSSEKFRGIEPLVVMSLLKMNYTLATQVLCDAMKCLFNKQNDIKTLKKWMAEVDVFLKEEWPALGDSEALEKQLEQC
ncbi:DMD protein, partial [Pitta sordida]|nr:DMD protein [Pitta sordida]